MRYDEHLCEYTFDSVSGYSVEGCAFVGYRTETEGLVDPRRMESWVVHLTGGVSSNGEPPAHLELGIHGYITGLWLSPKGGVYATERTGCLHIRAPETEWRRVDFGSEIELHGVWGFDDRDLYIWGRDPYRPLMWRLTTAGLEAVPAPEGRTTMVRGVASDLLYAAGDRGLLARWDGARWRRVRIPTVRNASGLFVGQSDDLWLTTDNGKLFEGTSHGWALRTQLDAPLYDVTRWRGTLYLAAGPRGLLRLIERSNDLAPVALDVAATCLESRGDLLALSPTYLASSSDGSSFRISCRDAVAALRCASIPSWRA